MLRFMNSTQRPVPVNTYSRDPFEHLVPAIIDAVKENGLTLTTWCRECMPYFSDLSKSYGLNPYNFHKLGKRKGSSNRVLNEFIAIAIILQIPTRVWYSRNTPVNYPAGDFASFMKDPAGYVTEIRGKIDSSFSVLDKYWSEQKLRKR